MVLGAAKFAGFGESVLRLVSTEFLRESLSLILPRKLLFMLLVFDDEVLRGGGWNAIGWQEDEEITRGMVLSSVMKWQVQT
jgi:hypothetical protein